MGIKGCWTCRERKVRCDLRKPTCGNCAKTLQSCKGYGMQLSWPREGNKRRAIVLDCDPSTLPRVSRRNRGRDVVFLNVSSADVALSDALGGKLSLADYLHDFPIPRLPHLSPFLLSWNDAHLLDYFKESRTRILAPIMDESLAYFVLKMAMTNSDSSFNLILEGILALSSVLLVGPSKSQYHKTRLISMLQKNIVQVDRESIIRNLIATMLLFQCEICNTADPGGLWRFYLCGAKKIISAVAPSVTLYQHDCIPLMDWIYYHEVMTEFSIRHWAEADAIDSFCKGPLAIRPGKISSMQGSDEVTCPTDVLDLVRHICKRPSPNGDNHIPYDNADMMRIQYLRQNIYETIGEYGTFHGDFESSLSRQDMINSLYRYAALIYLNRTVSYVSTSSFSHRRLVREGILLLQNLSFCEGTWPLFVIACEADKDEQRLQILDVLSNTSREVGQRSDHIVLIQHMVEAIWNQNDLTIESDVNYGRILNAVISKAPALPLFA
ncbi:fungal-specific transcription factor domain-containing protein [Trichoderma austrokoningii]